MSLVALSDPLGNPCYGSTKSQSMNSNELLESNMAAAHHIELRSTFILAPLNDIFFMSIGSIGLHIFVIIESKESNTTIVIIRRFISLFSFTGMVYSHG